MQTKSWILAVFLYGSLWGSDWKAIAAEQFYPESLKSKQLLAGAADKQLGEIKFISPIRKINFSYIDKEQKKSEIVQRGKAETEFLRDLDSTRKTEYFRNVLKSPVPESFKSSHDNGSQRATIFSFSSN